MVKKAGGVVCCAGDRRSVIRCQWPRRASAESDNRRVHGVLVEKYIEILISIDESYAGSIEYWKKAAYNCLYL
jgi:hypothetical protein